MATLSELAQVIAAVERVDPATVALIGRHLREAGLVTKHGRGPSAAHMGWTDAANLLIAVNATRNAAHAADAVSAFRWFRPYNKSIPRDLMNQDLTFGEAIEQLLVAAGSGKLPQPFLAQTDAHELSQLSELFATGEGLVELRFNTTSPSVLLKIYRETTRETPIKATPEMKVMSEMMIVHFSPRKARDPPKARKDQSGDRLDETTIGFRTLREVGRLIRSQSP